MRGLACLLLAGIVTATMLGTGSSGPAAAQTGTTLRLADQTLLVEPEGTVTFRLDLNGPLPDDAVLEVVVNGVLNPASEGVSRALVGDITAPTVAFLTFPVTELARDEAGRVVLEIPTVVRLRDRKPTNIRLAQIGVYAVTLTIRQERAGAPLQELVTFLVRTGPATDPAAKMTIAMVLPADSPPTLQPDGASVVAPADRARLQALVELLSSSHDELLTLAIRPDLLDGLRRTGLAGDSALLDELSGAVDDRLVLSQTQIALDPSAAEAAGLGPELTQLLRSGEDLLSALLPGTVPDRTTALSGPLTPSGLQTLRDLGVRRLVLPPEAVQPAEDIDRVTLISGISSLPVPSPAAQPLEVAIADPELGALLQPGADPVLSSTHLLAQLCALLFDSGAAPEDSPGVVLVPPVSWQPDPAFLATVVQGLAQNRLLQLVSLDTWFRTVDPSRDDGRPVTRQLAPATPQDLRDFANALHVTRAESATLGSILMPDNPMPGEVDALLTAGTTTALDAAGRQRYLDAAGAKLAPLRDAVDTMQRRRITIAGRATEIPLTLHANVAYPVRVKLRLSSAKLTFPEGDQVVEVDGSQQVRVPVEARASGTFPLTVELLSLTGDVPVGTTTQLTVQATALGGLGLLLSVGALVVLVTWWVHHVRTRRRQQRAQTATERHPATGTASTLDPR